MTAPNPPVVPDSLAALARLIVRGLSPLSLSLEAKDPEILGFVEQLGWILPQVPAGLRALQQAATATAGDVTALELALLAQDEDDSGDGGDEVLAAAALLLVDLATLLVAIRQLPGQLRTQLPADFVTRTGIADKFEQRLFDFAVATAVRDNAPLAYQILLALGVLSAEEQPEDTTVNQPPYVLYGTRPDRLGQVLSDPKGLLADVYGWGTPAINPDRLYAALAGITPFFLAPAEVQYPDEKLLAAVASGVPISEDEGPGAQLLIPLIDNGDVALDVALYPVPTATPGQPQPLALTLAATGDISVALPLDGGFSLEIAAGVGLEGGFALIVHPDAAPETVADLDSGGAPVRATGAVGLRLVNARDDGTATRLFTLPGGTFLEAAQLHVGGGAELSTDGAANAFFEAGLQKGKLVLGTGDTDGFLARFLPADGLTADVDLTVQWSSAHGVRLSGSGGLAITLPVQRQLGPFRLDSVTIEVAAANTGVNVAASAAGGFTLGPVTATVSGLGATATLKLAPGNLGPVDLGFAVKPPTGAGLSIEAGSVTGAGFLTFDPAHASYAGGLHLQLEKLVLDAIGLITTRLPDGSRDFSLLVLVQASGFTPVPLGFGISLTGVGGLLGINRSVALDALRDGVRSHALDSIMFLRDDPVPREAQIISTLATVFPPARDRFVIGPMVQLAWGTGGLVTAELAVVLELGTPLRLAVLGRLRAQLPDPDHAIVKLQLDTVGTVDFGRREASVDATLFDSFVGPFAISGDMALRASWGDRADFALSLGGFHPAYTPPANFPALKRLTLSLASGDNPRLRAEAYLAITANTIQVGAHLEMRISAHGFAVEGGLGFDALIYLDPFGFAADIGAHLALKRGSHTLMGIDLNVHLTGPNPWHVHGKVSFRILFFKVSFSVDASFGDSTDLPAAQAVAVWPLLREALQSAANWTAELPPDAGMLAVLRPPPADDGTALVHPFGAVRVRQRVVPLDRDIAHFGAAPPADFNRFSIASVDGAQLAGGVTDNFAPAQFLDLSDAQKLSAPGFEQMPAGARLTAPVGAQATGPAADCPLAFETITIGGPATGALFVPDTGALAQQARVGAAAGAATRTTGRLAYAGMAPPPRVTAPVFRVGTVTGLSPAAAATDGTYSDAAAAARGRRDLQVVRQEELVP
jgi:hypothetical protein